MPNNNRIQATHTGSVHLPGNLPAQACQAHLFRELNTNLLSIDQLCDHGCIAPTFTKEKVTLTRDNQTIITGYQDPKTSLWHIPIESKTPCLNFVTDRLEEEYEQRYGKPSPTPFGFDLNNVIPQANSAYQTKTMKNSYSFYMQPVAAWFSQHGSQRSTKDILLPGLDLHPA
jgi:hypothetical protein